MMRRSYTLMIAGALLAFGACDDSGGGSSATTPNDTSTSTTPNDTSTSTTPNDTSTSTSTTPNDTSTSPNDTSAVSDTAAPAGTCVDVAECTRSCTTEICLQACLASNPQASGEAYLDLIACLAPMSEDNPDGHDCAPSSNSPTDQEVKDQATCQRTHCLTETTACYAETFGASNCVTVNNCIASNCADDPTDLGCLHDCLSQGSEQAAQIWLNFNFCATAACYDSSATQAEQQTCVNGVQASNGACYNELQQCTSNTGAAPGAAGAGELPFDGQFRAFFQ